MNKVIAGPSYYTATKTAFGLWKLPDMREWTIVTDDNYRALYGLDLIEGRDHVYVIGMISNELRQQLTTRGWHPGWQNLELAE